MKFTVLFITLLSTSWAVKMQKSEDPKDKREAPVGYPSAGQSQHSYQSPSFGHEDASAISVGAGYSIGGAKPSYSYGAPEGALQLSSEGLQPSGHATIQLPAITLQPNHGGIVSSDLSQLMSQLSQGLNSGSLTLSPYQSGGQSAHGGQELSLPQFSYGAPQQQYTFSEQSIPNSPPSYSAGSKGLGSYSSTGPVLFNPADSQSSQPALSYGAPSSGHSFGDAGGISFGGSGHSLAGLSLGGSGQSLAGLLEGSGYTLGGSGHSLGGSLHSLGGSGQSLGGSGHSLGGSGHSLGGSGLSFGGSGHSFGGSGHSLGGSGHSLSGGGHSHGSAGYSLGGSGHSQGGFGHSQGGAGHSHGGSGHSFGGPYKYVVPSKASFKPSAYIGSSDSHSLSGLSGSYGAPSFSSHALSGGHGKPGHGLSLGSGGHGASFSGSLGSFGGGSSKFVAPSYIPPKSEGFGSSQESVTAFSSHGHASSPPGTTYGVPTASYAPSSASHAASSHSPQYYVTSSKYASPSFGEGSSSYRAPSSGHSSVNSFSSGPKYSFGGHSGLSSRYGSPKDNQGAHSETVYNTIKYSEELKPRAQ